MRLLVVATALFLAACSGGGESLKALEPDSVILAFGDSLTYGTGVDAEMSYPAVLSGLSGHRVIRSGVPGEISAVGKRRLRKVLDEHKPALVVLCHGGNDILRRMPAGVTEQNLRDMVLMIREAGSDVIVIAVPAFGLFPSAPSYYEDIARDLGVPVEFDILSRLESDQSRKSDQVHFNDLGYREMAEAVYELLVSEGAL